MIPLRPTRLTENQLALSHWSIVSGPSSLRRQQSVLDIMMLNDKTVRIEFEKSFRSDEALANNHDWKIMKTQMLNVRAALFALALYFVASSAFAGSATWNTIAGSADWNTASNWTPVTVPNGSGDTATFATSNFTNLALSAITEVNGIVFNPGAFVFTITSGPSTQLSITGAGITNNSGVGQAFVADVVGANEGIILFTNSASAGTQTFFTIKGSTTMGISGALMDFRNTSSAANATITGTGGSADGASGGETEFFDHSTAGMATFHNNGGLANNAFGGFVIFENNSTAGAATFTNSSGVVSGARGGGIAFTGDADAGSATITNEGGTNGGEGGTTNFTSNAKGGSADITNSASDGSMGSTGGNTDFSTSADAQMVTIGNAGATISGGQGGSTAFEQNATAGDGSIITNDGAAVSGASAPGRTFFEAGPATAGNTTIFNLGGNASGALGGQTFFQDTSNAGTAHINNSGSSINMAGGGQTTFQDGSNASGAFIVSDAGSSLGAGGGRVDFFNASMAGQATFITNGGGFLGGAPGVTDFHDMSSGDHGNFTSNGGSGLGGAGGQTEFFNSSHADNATLTANAGSMLGAFGAFTAFWDTSAANNATLIANGGPGEGGGIYFFVSSTGDTARVEVFDNGFLDISDRAVATPDVTVGSIEGSGNVFLGSHNLTVGTNNLSTIFSGVIQDGGENGGMGGSLTKVGTGKLVLSGINTYTLDTFVDGGALIVNGSIASPATFVDVADALLGGNGTIGGNVNSFGIVSPGDNGPGTLHVTGIYQQFSTSTLRIEIGGVGLGQYDLLAGASNTFLDGTLQLLRINNFMPAPGDHVVIVSGTGLGGTMFSATDSSTFVGLIQPNVVYTATTVDVVFDLSAPFASQAFTPNQISVANELDEVANDPRAADLIAFVGSEPLGNLPHDYDLIAPEELASIYEIGFSQAVVTNMNLQHRMDDIRAGSSGFCANGYQVQESGYSKGADGKTLLDKNPTPAFVPSPENRWGVFVTGSGDFVNVGNHDDNAHGYDITTGNVTVGVDYRVCDHFAVGIDGGYSGSTADLVDRGRVEVDGGKAGAYATVFGYKILGSVIHIDGAVSGGWNSYDTNRTGLEDLPVRGSTNGSELNAMLAYGGDWHFGCLLIGTWSSLQYTNINIDSFTETGSLAPLQIQDQNEDSFRTSSGVRLAYDIKSGSAIIRPEVRAAWQHEYGDRAYPIDARFASGAGDVFTVHGPAIGRDAALVDAGFALQWSSRFSTYVYYDGVLGRSNYDNNAVSGGFRLSF
jgi:autotransporter-associated beta strand protein